MGVDPTGRNFLLMIGLALGESLPVHVRFSLIEMAEVDVFFGVSLGEGRRVGLVAGIVGMVGIVDVDVEAMAVIEVSGSSSIIIMDNLLLG